METLLCLDAEATFLGIFDPGIAPQLLYYAYLPIILISLILGSLVLLNKNKFHLPNKLFFIFIIVYTLYLCNEIIQWIAVPAGLVHFAWGLTALFFALIPIILFYFVFTFIKQKDLSFTGKWILFLGLTPVLLFLSTTLNAKYLDIALCRSEIGELNMYLYVLISICSVSIGYLGIKSSRSLKKKESLILACGAILMLLMLMYADAVSESVGNFEFNLIGPLGMLVFMTIITYMIVTYHAFDLKVAGAQALVSALVILVGSQLLFIKSDTSRVLVSITLAMSMIGGYYLVKSVKREIKQREEIEKLAEKLSKANTRLRELDKQKSEFVSIASHQLRSPLTAIRGYASMVIEGSYGQIPEKAKESLIRIEESAELMAMSVEDYLNVSRIESGNMKYVYSDFNLNDSVSKICDDLRPVAMKRNLILLHRSDLKSRGIVHADVGKTHQIIHNLINNSIKYTEKGSISVFVRDDLTKKRIYVDITDTGIGMNEKTLHTIFQKFERANNANSVNVSGTGLGLYVALKMAEAMGGTITAHSEGDGKGSRFTIEMPLAL